MKRQISILLVVLLLIVVIGILFIAARQNHVLFNLNDNNQASQETYQEYKGKKIILLKSPKLIYKPIVQTAGSIETILVLSPSTPLPVAKIEVYDETDRRKLSAKIVNRSPQETQLKTFGIRYISPSASALIIVYDHNTKINDLINLIHTNQ